LIVPRTREPRISIDWRLVVLPDPLGPTSAVKGARGIPAVQGDSMFANAWNDEM
jgi:hypothetical protein